MIPARITLWLVLYFSIIVQTFLSNNLNIAMVSMVKYTETVSENISAVCYNAPAYPSNTTTIQKTESYATNMLNTLEWSENDRNLVLGAFNAFPWISPFLGGYLSHRYGTKLVTGWGIFVPCMMSSLIPFIAHINPLLVAVVRLIQGIITPIAFPSGIYSVAAKWFPAHERGKFFIVFSANSIGNALTFLICGFIADIFGWSYVFYTSTFIGLLWFILWQYLFYDTPEKHPRISSSELSYIQKSLNTTVAKEKLPVPWKVIFTSVPYLINMINYIGAAWVRLAVLMYMPTYFKLVHGLNSKENGLVSGMPFILRAGCTCIFAFFADHLLQKNVLSKTQVRNIITFISTVIGGLMLIGVAFVNCSTSLAIVFISACIVLNCGFVHGAAAGIVDMSPNFCAILIGISASISSITGILIPFSVSLAANIYNSDLLEQWKMVWFLAGSIYAISGLVFILWSDSELQPWNTVYQEPSDTDKNLLQKMQPEVE